MTPAELTGIVQYVAKMKSSRKLETTYDGAWNIFGKKIRDEIHKARDK